MLVISSVAKVILLVSMAVAAVAAESAEPPRRDFPRVGEYEVLCGDFHVHTTYSDGVISVRERIEEAAGLGYNAIAITDHGTTRGCRVARQAGEELGMVVIGGFETGTSGPGGGEHLVVLGVPPSYPARDGHVMSLIPGADKVFYQDEIRRIADAGGAVFYAHPNYGKQQGKDAMVAAGGDAHLETNVIPEAVMWGIREGFIVGIEVQNGWGDEDFCWGVARHGETWCYPHGFEWALRHNLAPFANTDGHAVNTKPDQPVTLVFTRTRNADGVMEAIRDRRTAAWFNGMVWAQEKLLTGLVSAAVTVRPGDEGRLLLENRCPIALTCSPVNRPDEELKLAPYSATQTDWQVDRAVPVVWTNLWTSTSNNLRTTIRAGR